MLRDFPRVVTQTVQGRSTDARFGPNLLRDLVLQNWQMTSLPFDLAERCSGPDCPHLQVEPFGIRICFNIKRFYAVRPGDFDGVFEEFPTNPSPQMGRQDPEMFEPRLERQTGKSMETHNFMIVGGHVDGIPGDIVRCDGQCLIPNIQPMIGVPPNRFAGASDSG